MIDDQPVRVTAFDTREPDVAHALVRRLDESERFAIDGPARTFRLRLRAAQVGPMLLVRTSVSFEARLASEPAGWFSCVTPQAGALTVSPHHRPDSHLKPGQVWLYSGDEPAQTVYSAHSTLSGLHLPLGRITETASERAGEQARVRFLDSTPLDAAHEQCWLLLRRLAQRQANVPDSPLSQPLIREHLITALAGAALTAFPNTTMTAHYRPGAGHVGPATLRRAVDFMHAHAGRPLTLAEIAEVSGLSARALQKTFRQHYECSPMTYLRRIRPERAHEALVAGDPGRGDQVGVIAARWGFTHLGRFAAEYRRRYGASPSTTLPG